MTLRAVRLALVAWVAALILPTTTLAHFTNLSVEPIDISALTRMLREETGAEPADWDAFERLHMEYVERHGPLVERSCQAIKSSEGDHARQRKPSIELQLAQQELDGALFTAVAALMPADAAAGIERVRVRRELAVIARMSGWLGGVTAIDVAASLQRVLRDDAARWAELKPEVDRHRLARRDLVRRVLRGIGDAFDCTDRNAAQQESTWVRYTELAERIAGVEREAAGVAGGVGAVPAEVEPADPARDGAGSSEADVVKRAELLESLQRDQQAELAHLSSLHNECWQSTTEAIVGVVDHEVALFFSLAPRLTAQQRMTWRRSMANELSVGTDRGYGVEQTALALLRAPGVDQPLRERILAALTRWADEDGAVQEAMFRTAGERIAEQYRWQFGTEEQPPGVRAFMEGSAKRETRAASARTAMQAMVVAQVGEEAAGAGFASIEQAAAEGRKVDLVLGDDPEAPEVDGEPADSFDATLVAHRLRPTLALLDRFIEACRIPESQADSMRALLATHESIVSAIAQGDLAALRGEQIELMERVKTMNYGDAVAAVEAYAARTRTTEARIHDADDAFWTALGELAGETLPDFAVAMRVSAGLAPVDEARAVVTAPIPGDPVRVALRCVSDEAQQRLVLSAAASVEPAESAVLSELREAWASVGFEWLYGGLLWWTRADVSDEERAAFGEASRARQTELMQRYRQAIQRRESLRASLTRDLEASVGTKHAWSFHRACAAQAAPNGFRDRQRIMPVLDSLLANAGLPAGARADVLGLKDDLEPELRRAEERLIESMDALVGDRPTAEEWVDQSARAHATLWVWWLRDEVERRCAERLRRVVPESLLPDSALRPIRDVERGRYGM